MNTFLIVCIVVLILLVTYLIYHSMTSTNPTESSFDILMRQLGAKKNDDTFGNTQNCDNFEMNTINDVYSNPHCYIKLYHRSLYNIDLNELDEKTQTEINDKIMDYVNAPIDESITPVNDEKYIRISKLLENASLPGILNYYLTLSSLLVNINNSEIINTIMASTILLQVRLSTLFDNSMTKESKGFFIHDKATNTIKLNLNSADTNNCIDYISKTLETDTYVNLNDGGCYIIRIDQLKNYFEFLYKDDPLYQLKDNNELLEIIFNDLKQIVVDNIQNITADNKGDNYSKLNDKFDIITQTDVYNRLPDDQKLVVTNIYQPEM